MQHFDSIWFKFLSHSQDSWAEEASAAAPPEDDTYLERHTHTHLSHPHTLNFLLMSFKCKKPLDAFSHSLSLSLSFCEAFPTLGTWCTALWRSIPRVFTFPFFSISPLFFPHFSDGSAHRWPNSFRIFFGYNQTLSTLNAVHITWYVVDQNDGE